jgi:hypothetical protein
MKTIKKPFTVFAKVLAIPVLAFLLSPLYSYADDTAALQAQLTAGNVTLTAGKVYSVTGLTVTHALNMNGATITMPSTVTTGAAIKLMAAGASITNGTITGAWDYTTASNPSGVIGVRILANSCSVTHITLSSFSGYGILIGPYTAPVITNCNISKIGYIGVYYCPEASMAGGTFSNNVVDRSMISPTTVNQGAVQIRASTANAALSTTGWTITGNTIIMPSLPASTANECMEIRFMKSSTVSGNTFTAGSIGASIVGCSNISLTSNKFSGSSNEAIEFANSTNCTSTSNIVSSSLGVAVLLDGNTGCNGIQLVSDSYANTSSDCVHAIALTSNLTISGCTFAVTKGNRAMNLRGTSGVNIKNSTFNGLVNGVPGATQVVYLDTCPGNITLTGGVISNFTTCVVAIYSAQAGLVTNNVSVSGATITHVPKSITTLVSNGATVGTTNIEAVAPAN